MQIVSMTLAGCAAAIGISTAALAADVDGAAQVRGAAVFSTYCVLCHGPAGKGDGRAAAMQQVPPADLTASRRTNAYKLQIIRGGGARMNRSSSMPAWAEVLTAGQIADVAVYLRTLADSRTAANPQTVSSTPTATQATTARTASPSVRRATPP
jgi:mono/diheme cytochrome c family protein